MTRFFSKQIASKKFKFKLKKGELINESYLRNTLMWHVLFLDPDSKR
jgi:hypothetical protein